MATYKKPFEIEEKDLARLSADDFTKLMKRLITAEVHKAGIPKSAVEGTLQINISDGGEDIRVQWTGGPDQTDYIPARFTVFQCKAENLTDAKVRNEPQTDDKTALKPAVAEVMANQGAYVLATTKTNTTTPKTLTAAATKTKKAKRAKKAKKTAKRPASIPKLKHLIELIRGTLSRHGDVGNTKIGVYGAPKLSDWVNSHPMIAIWTKQCLGMASPTFPFQTIENWASYPDLRNPLVEWSAFDDQIVKIRDAVSGLAGVVRLQGHSGLGKSRLVFEALNKAAADAPGDDLRPLVAYVRAVTPGLAVQVRDLVSDGVRAVVVVDDCPPDMHRQLSDEVRRQNSAVSLITLDLSFDDTADKQIVIDEVPDDQIKEILRKVGFIGSDDDLERATKFCNGFPQIAVLVGKASAEGATHFADFKDAGRIVERLVWGRDEPDDDKIWLLRALSVFALIGFDGKRQEEFAWVAENLLETTSDKAQERLEPFRRRRILQSRGFSIFVVPKPLAAQLAAYYWTHGPTGKRALLTGGQLPGDLQRQLCERLKDLDYLDNVKSVAAQLCGADGPFGSAEALNTEFGAQCLRALAEVAPEEVTNALMRSFGDWDVHTVREHLTVGRRQLVWAIDALAWEPSVFDDAMRLLLKFAAGENEKWSNNATGEFIQRFRIELPGTSASLAERSAALRHYLDGAVDEELSVLIKAMIAGIDATGHSRIVGSERHGTKTTYIDYRPKTYGEIYQYAKELLDLLFQLVEQHPERTDEVRDALAIINPAIVIAGVVFPAYVALINAVKPKSGIWPELLEKLAWTLRHQLTGDNPDIEPARNRVHSLFNSLEPQSLAARIEFFVKSVPWHYEAPGDDKDDDFTLNRKRAKEIAREAAQNWDAFVETAGLLSEGETREVFAYGQAFFGATDRKADALEIARQELKVRGARGNPSLLGGLLAGLFEHNPDKVLGVLQSVANDEVLKRHLAYLAVVNLTPQGLGLVSDALSRGAIDVKDLYIYGMGRVLEAMPLELVKSFIANARSRGSDGEKVALHLLVMYSHSSDDKFEAIRDEVLISLKSGVAFEDADRNQRIEHDYETLANKMLKRKPQAKSFAIYLAKNLVSVINDGRPGSSMLYQNLTAAILDAYPTEVLEIFAEAVDDADPSGRWHFSSILGSPFSFKGKGDGPLFRLEKDVILAACHKYPKSFARMVAEVAPLFRGGEDGRQWSDLGLALLEDFGHEKEILSAIERNIFTGGYSGPTSRHYQSYIAPLEQLVRHRRPSVKSWAKKELAALRKQVDREIKNEEEAAARSA